MDTFPSPIKWIFLPLGFQRNLTHSKCFVSRGHHQNHYFGRQNLPRHLLSLLKMLDKSKQDISMYDRYVADVISCRTDNIYFWILWILTCPLFLFSVTLHLHPTFGCKTHYLIRWIIILTTNYCNKFSDLGHDHDHDLIHAEDC